MALKIAVLEDDRDVADCLAKMLAELGHEVCGVAHQVHELADILAVHDPELVTLDLNLGKGGEGIGVATALEAAGPIAILFVTGDLKDQQMDEIRACEGAWVVFKPVTLDELSQGLDKAMARARAARHPEVDTPGRWAEPS